MSESKFITIVTEDGTRLTVQKPKRLIDLLPKALEAAKETGPSDSAVNAGWLYSERGKAPR